MCGGYCALFSSATGRKSTACHVFSCPELQTSASKWQAERYHDDWPQRKKPSGRNQMGVPCRLSEQGESKRERELDKRKREQAERTMKKKRSNESAKGAPLKDARRITFKILE